MNSISVENLSVIFKNPRCNPEKGVLRKKYIYEHLYALNNLSFSVKEGEIVGIIGENGSGKTTLLSTLSGILKPDKGTFSISGRVSGILGLGIGCKPELSARDNIYLYASMFGIRNKETKKKFDEIIDFAEITNFVDTKLINFSSGMLLRFAFSIAVNINPDILLIDDILSVGDSSFQKKSFRKIHDFKSRGKTMLIVSHGLGDLANICDRLMLIHNGELISSGNVDTVIGKYLNILDEKEKQKHTDIGESSDTGNILRWGSTEITVSKVGFLDNHNKESNVFNYGSSMTVRIHYTTDKTINDPVFGIALYNKNGIEIDGPNTKSAGYATGVISGSGYIDYIINPLHLYAGEYLLSVSVYDQTVNHAFDHHDRMYKFEVTGKNAWDNGIITIPATWRINK